MIQGFFFLIGLVISMQNLQRINFMMADDILKTTMVDKLPNDLEGMEASMERLLALIDEVYKYVDNVVVKYHTFSFHACLLFVRYYKCNMFFLRKGMLLRITALGDLYQRLYHPFPNCLHQPLISL